MFKGRLATLSLAGGLGGLIVATIVVFNLIAGVTASGNSVAKNGSSSGSGSTSSAGQPSQTALYNEALAQGAPLHGATPPPLDFKDQNGQQVSLSQFKGHPVVLTFFDSVCPHPDCSLIASYINYTAKYLGDKTNQVAWMAVSVNPWQDTPSSVKEFLSTRQVTIPMHYLLGTPDQMKPVWNALHMQVIRQSNGVVLHTTGVYVIDGTGKEQLFMDEGFDPKALSAYVQHMLASPGASDKSLSGTGNGVNGKTVTATASANGYTLGLTVTPSQYGTFNFTVMLLGTNQYPLDGAKLSAVLDMPTMQMIPVNIKLPPIKPAVPGAYSASGVLSMAGPWTADVTVQPPSGSSFHAKFDFNVTF